MEIKLNIDDDLYRELRLIAERDQRSLTSVLNHAIRHGLEQWTNPLNKAEQYREATHALGVPFVDMTKALTLAAELEDEEILKKFRLGK
jgi:hypothetical protein